MLIQDKPLQHWLDHFYGYGTWQAKIWFVAYEDGGGDLPEEVAEKLDYFYGAYPSANEPTLTDIRELYRNFSIHWDGPKAEVFTNLYEYRFGPNAIVSPVWRNLIAFAHGYKNERLPDPLAYQKNVFVMPSANRESLIKLYPLPSPHNHSWYYSWLDLPQFPFLKSREQYEEHVYPARMKSILRNIGIYKPDLVLMYGMNNINGMKRSVEEVFPSINFRMVKAVKQVLPQHHRADFDGTTLLITTQIPTLRHNRVETGFDWFEFGGRTRSQR